MQCVALSWILTRINQLIKKKKKTTEALEHWTLTRMIAGVFGCDNGIAIFQKESLSFRAACWNIPGWDATMPGACFEIIPRWGVERREMKQNWPWVGNCWSWMMGAWGFVTLVSPLLYVFEIFHDEQELKKQKKKKTSGQQTPRCARPVGPSGPAGFWLFPSHSLLWVGFLLHRDWCLVRAPSLMSVISVICLFVSVYCLFLLGHSQQGTELLDYPPIRAHFL